MHEDEQLYLDAASSHMPQEQTELLVKVNRLTVLVWVFGAGSGVLLLVSNRETFVRFGNALVIPKGAVRPTRAMQRAETLVRWLAEHSVDATLIAGAESVSQPSIAVARGIAIEKIERSVSRHSAVVGDAIVGCGRTL